MEFCVGYPRRGDILAPKNLSRPRRPESGSGADCVSEYVLGYIRIVRLAPFFFFFFFSLFSFVFSKNDRGVDRNIKQGESLLLSPLLV